MDTNLRLILQQLEAEKSIDRATLLEAIRSAIESAARKSMSESSDVVVEIDEDTLGFKVFEIRSVVEDVTDPVTELSLADAQALNPNARVGVRLKVEAQPQDFGRIAAQTAKQVIIQKIKDAERDNIYDEFKDREGELVTGIVKRHHQGNVIVTVDRAEAIIPPREQAGRESLRTGDRIRAVLIAVNKESRGAQLILSRATPDLVRLLFQMEVPEIYDGTVELKAIAREPGSRAKVAVKSNDPNVDPVGACVGLKGSRVRAVVEELSGEKIDIVHWSEDVAELCRNALNPADIIEISENDETNTITVTVPEEQLSLAIGKRGQNARLASRLMGWNIDIISRARPESKQAQPGPDMLDPAATDENVGEFTGDLSRDDASTPSPETESLGESSGNAGDEQESDMVVNADVESAGRS